MSDRTVQGGNPRRRRFAPLVWLGSLGAFGVLALGVNGSLSAFTASITNTDNNIATGTLVMKETGPGATCVSSDASASCSTINKYGNAGVAVTNLIPGGSATTTVNISNTGTSNAATFTLAFDPCSQTPTATAGPPVIGDLCGELTVAVHLGTATGPVVASGTPSSLATGSPFALTPALNATTGGGSGQDYTFVVTLPSSAGNSFQGIEAMQAITWSFAA